jgi:hypothetical protein
VYEGSGSTMYQILNTIRFKYLKCNKGTKFVVEHSYIIPVRTMNFREINEI